MKITRDFVIQNLADSGLMSADDASSLCESLSSLSGPADSDTVAQELSGTDKLTAYQAECVCRGETSGLMFGDYLVLEKIGQGGMGVVLKAQHTRMERIVAVKKLTAAALESEDLVKRFYREVKASARLLHPNVVTALDAREHEGVHYLIMEFIEGEDLSDVLKRQGPLPVDEAVDYVVQAAQGLEFAHKHGVYHRDIKPANLLLDHEGTVKILDMGLARIVSEAKGNEASRDQLTSDDQVMGTCDYMAPEQAENTKGVDHRADIYSLGCTLYRLLTNSAPYTGANLMQLLLAHRESPIPSICDKRPDVPASVDAVFQKMMAKTREERYQSMTEVIEALQAALGRGSAPAAAPAPDPGLMDFLKQIHDEPSGVSRGGRGSGKTDAAQAAVTVQEKADPITDETVDMSATADTDPSTSTRQPSTPAAPAARPKKPAARRRKKQAPMLLLIGVGIGISLIGAAVVAAVLYVQTNYGTVVVSTHDEDVEVLVKRGGDVHVADAKNRWRIELKSGKYSVELKEGNDRFVLDKDTITVTRGDEVRVRVELKPRPKPPRPAIADRPSPNGLKFSGDGYVAFKTLRYTGSSPITIEAYVTPESSKSTRQILSNVQSSGLGLNMSDDGMWQFVFHDAEHYQRVVSDHKAKIGEMTHVAGVYDGRTLHLYVSGKVQQSVATTSGPHKSSRYPLMMGADPGNGGRPERFFRGIIHQLRVSKTARYTSDFQPDAQLQADSDTEALYRMDNDTGDTLKDLSGHQHHGTIHKAEWYRLAISPPATGRDGESPPTGVDAAAPSAVSLDDLPPWQLPPDAPKPAIAPFDAVQAKEHQDAWADYLKLPVEREFDLPGGEKLAMVLIPPGDFLMGSPEAERQRVFAEANAANDTTAVNRLSVEAPQHPVRITWPFYLGKYEVTQAQWQAVIGDNPSYHKKDPRNPVEQKMSWGAIQPFLSKVDTLSLKAGMTFVLPTEAQWEYACRAGTTTAYCFGDDAATLVEYGWFKGITRFTHPHPVGEKKANAWGLHDMHGNVWERCRDSYAADYYRQSPLEDPFGPERVSGQVIRGGSDRQFPWNCRSAFRTNGSQGVYGSHVGFRVASVIPYPSKRTTGGAAAACHALYFDGQSYVSLPKLDLDTTQPYTIEAVITPKSQPDSPASFVGNQQQAGTGLWIAKSHAVFLRHSGEGGKMYADPRSDRPVVVGQLIHVAGVFDGKQVRLYIDGKRQSADGTIGSAHVKSELVWYIGADPAEDNSPDRHFCGIIHNVRVSQTARYDADFEPADQFEPDADTAALYRFDEGEGDVLHDSSDNAAHGKIVGANWVKVGQLPIAGTPQPETATPPSATPGDADPAKPEEPAGAEEDSADGVRTWTDTSGKTVEAAFVDVKDGTVRLRLPDGKIASVALDKLCDEDKAYVAQQAERNVAP